ncbi:hypothetical protein [Senegalia massiliensis]|uniref:TraC-like domain-containing protein n=1 Tax=Senegalia massiliensis TaxID=1720316 RepID=A0A845R0R9_9CLOT|nr:hypothetical protein [Senegalia massiliensis]NBI07599.1 hypothetical protein [Senegalia massiliensis]
MLSVAKYIIFGVSFLTIIGLGIVLYRDNKSTKIKKNDNNPINNKKSKKNKSKNKKESNKDNKNNEDIKYEYTQDFLEFESIEVYTQNNPLGIIKKDKYNYVCLLEVYGVNFNLLDLSERNTLEKEFQKLLNGIDYPIQLFIQSRKIDIEMYMKNYLTRLKEIENEYSRALKKIGYLKEKSNNEKIAELEYWEEQSLKIKSKYQYGRKLMNYIERRFKQKHMLERRYYISLAFTHNPNKYKEELNDKEILSEAFFQLINKAESIIGALKTTKLKGQLLDGNTLAEVLYISYNKADYENYRIQNAFKSGFSHLYTTADSMEVKDMKLRLQELKKEENNLKENLDNNMEVSESEKVGA